MAQFRNRLVRLASVILGWGLLGIVLVIGGLLAILESIVSRLVRREDPGQAAWHRGAVRGTPARRPPHVPPAAGEEH